MGYAGLRMTAQEYLALGETPERYELLDGVVVMMSPSPFANHNEIAAQVSYQIQLFAGPQRTVRVFPETDLQCSDRTVYRPDLSVYQTGRLPPKVPRLTTPPDLIVEVVSRGSKAYDLITKRQDYDRFGVGEYWVIDPDDGSMKCWQRQGSSLVQVETNRDTLASSSIPGLVLDLHAIREIAGSED
jgi:Uma2 family endonuclease